jgi:hypothetical protein
MMMKKELLGRMFLIILVFKFEKKNLKIKFFLSDKKKKEKFLNKS